MSADSCEVSFSGNGVVLTGSLVVPDRAGLSAGVVMVGGSGASATTRQR